MPTIFEGPTKKTRKTMATLTTSSRHDHMGPLTVFAVNPDGIRFETQEAEETVVLFLRQHLIVFFVPIVILVLLILGPTLLIPLIPALNLPVSLPSSYILIGTLFWYLATFGFALVSFLRWFFNIYIVTNERVVDIDFKYLLYKEFSEARIEKIQDLTYRSGGIIAAFFNYGDVLVETAGEVPNIEFDKVPRPEKVVQTISELMGKFKGENI